MWKAIAISRLRWTGAYCLFVVLALVFLLFAWPYFLLQRLERRAKGSGTS